MKSFVALWRSESWMARLLLAGAITFGALSALNLGLDVLLGFVSQWPWQDIADEVVGVAFAAAMYESVYWRRRALTAEKPLRPTQVVVEHSTIGAANVARMVEEVKRREKAAKAQS